MVNLDIVLRQKGITRTRLGEMVHLTQPAITHIITSGSTSTTTAIRIAKALDVSLDQLCGLEPGNSEYIYISSIKNSLKQLTSLITVKCSLPDMPYEEETTG